MATSAKDKNMQCDLEWNTNEMQYACRGSAQDEKDMEFKTAGDLVK